jgi:hypothetical protein
MKTMAGLLAACALIPGGAQAQSFLFRDGFETPCTMEDVDQDRLSNCEEARLATDPLRADSDGDGLLDGDEALGTIRGLDLPAMGVDPRRRDLLVEFDWSGDAFDCAQHSHRPTPQNVEKIRAFFARAPLTNRDGTTGINLIVDYGQGGIFTGGNFVDVPDGAAGNLHEPYLTIKAANFAANRAGYFRYQLHVHRTSIDPLIDYGGIAYWPGDDSVVAMHCNFSAPHVELVILHELGHNLGLHHGGSDDCDFKPNYNSIMNMRFQHGLDVDCDTFSDPAANVIAFSDGSRPTLDPLAVVEGDGVCPRDHPAHQPVDWNCNGSIDPGSVADPLLRCHRILVSDHDDYSSLRIPPVSPPASGPAKVHRGGDFDVIASEHVIGDSFGHVPGTASRKARSGGWPCPHPVPFP